LIKEEGGSVITIKNVTYASTPSMCNPNTEQYNNADNNKVGTGSIVEIENTHAMIREYYFSNDEYLSGFNWSVHRFKRKT
jgi:hypothetical protein